MAEPSCAIISAETERQFVNELERMNPTYALAFRLIVETGIPYTHLIALKVSDVYGKDTLTYSARQGTVRKMPLSLTTKQKITALCLRKAPDDTLLIGKVRSQPLHSATFTLALKSASEACDIDPPVTIKSCHKTFLWHLLCQTGDIRQVKKYVHTNSESELYTYIGIPETEPIGALPTEAIRETTITDAYADELSNRFDATMYRISKAMRQIDAMPVSYSKALEEFFQSIDSAIIEFRKKGGFNTDGQNPGQQE